MFKNMKLSAKIASLAVILIFLGCVVAYFGYSGLTGVVDRERIHDHLAKMPELANPPNADLSKGFTVAQVAEKHACAPKVRKIALGAGQSRWCGLWPLMERKISKIQRAWMWIKDMGSVELQ